MWLFTEHGFFSVVRADPSKVDGIPADEPHVMVRARVESDLTNIQAAWSKQNEGTAPEILRWKGRDYPARLIMPQAEWTQILTTMSDDIDYSNFKARVKLTQGAERASLYMDIWSTMNGAARKLKKAKERLAKALFKGNNKGRRSRRSRRSETQSAEREQTQLDRWFEANDYTPGEHGLSWDDEAPLPEEDTKPGIARTELPEGTSQVVDLEVEEEEELIVLEA